MLRHVIPLVTNHFSNIFGNFIVNLPRYFFIIFCFDVHMIMMSYYYFAACHIGSASIPPLRRYFDISFGKISSNALFRASSLFVFSLIIEVPRRPLFFKVLYGSYFREHQVVSSYGHYFNSLANRRRNRFSWSLFRFPLSHSISPCSQKRFHFTSISFSLALFSTTSLS